MEIPNADRPVVSPIFSRVQRLENKHIAGFLQLLDGSLLVLSVCISDPAALPELQVPIQHDPGHGHFAELREKGVKVLW